MPKAAGAGSPLSHLSSTTSATPIKAPVTIKRAASPSSPERSPAHTKPPFSTFTKGRADHGTNDEFKTGTGKFDDVVSERFAARIQKKWYNFDTTVKVASLERMNLVHTHSILNCKAKVDSSCPRSLQIMEEDGRLNALNGSALAASEARRRQRSKYHNMWQSQHNSWLQVHHDNMEAKRHVNHSTAAFALPAAVKDYVRSSEKELEMALRDDDGNSDENIENLEEDRDLEKLTIQLAKGRGGTGGAMAIERPSSAVSGMRPRSALSTRPASAQERRSSSALTAAAAAKFVSRQHGHLPPDMRREMLRSKVRSNDAPPTWRGPLEAQKAKLKEREEEQRRTNPTPRQIWLEEQRLERRAKREASHNTIDHNVSTSSDHHVHIVGHGHGTPYAHSESEYRAFYSQHPHIIPEMPEVADPTRTVVSPSWRNKLLDQIQYSRSKTVSASTVPIVAKHTLCFEFSPKRAKTDEDSFAIVVESLTQTKAETNGKPSVARSPSSISAASQKPEVDQPATPVATPGGVSRSSSKADRSPRNGNVSAISTIASEGAVTPVTSRKRPIVQSKGPAAGSPLEHYKWSWA